MGSFDFPVAYTAMIPALCERSLAKLSSAHAASNAFSSARASSNSSSAPSNYFLPCDNIVAPSTDFSPQSSLLSLLISLFDFPLIVS